MFAPLVNSRSRQVIKKRSKAFTGTDKWSLIEETVGREFFRFAQHPPHTRFDTMGGFFDQYKELLGTLSPCDMVHLSSRSRYVCYPFKPEMCSKFVK